MIHTLLQCTVCVQHLLHLLGEKKMDLSLSLSHPPSSMVMNMQRGVDMGEVWLGGLDEKTFESVLKDHMG